MTEVMETVAVGQLFQQLMGQEGNARVTYLQQHSDKLLTFLRQGKNGKNAGGDALTQQLLKGIIQVIYSKKNAELTPALLTLTNNVLSLNGICLNFLLQSPLALKIIRTYCCNLLTKFEDQVERETQKKSSQQYFGLYSVLYILAVFASHRTTDQKQKKSINSVLNKSLLRKVLLLELNAQYKPELFYLVSIIMVYCCRPCFKGAFIPLLKKSILPQFEMLPLQHKLTFNYIYCLRTILSNEGLANEDVLKHRVVTFVMNSCRYPMHDSQLVYSLDCVRMLMFGQAVIITKFLEAGVMPLLIQAYDKNRLLASKIFEKVAMYIKPQECLELSCQFKEAIRQQPHIEQNLKCLTAMLAHLPISNLISILEDGLIDDIDNMLNTSKMNHSMALSAINLLDSVITSCRNRLGSIVRMLLAKIQRSNILTKMQNSTEETIQQLVERFIDRHYNNY